MKRSVSVKLRRFGLPGSARTVGDVLDRVQEVTGRPLELIPVSFGDRRHTAAWTYDEVTNCDYIFVERTLAPYQRPASILHEVGHIVGGHRLSEPMAEWPFLLTVDAARLGADGAVSRMLLRSCGDGTDEREAELIADVLLGALTSRVGQSNKFDEAFWP